MKSRALMTATLAIALTTTLAASQACAQPPADNAERATLVAAAKADPATRPFDGYAYKPASTWLGASYAYLCATWADAQGRRSYTDDQIDTANVYFYKSGTQWQVAAHVESFSKNPSRISCLENSKRLSDESAFAAIRRQVLDDPGAKPAATCARLNTIAQAAPGFHPSVTAKVTATGKTWLYDAPSDRCKTDKHLVPNDHVTVYTPIGGWAYVMYINPKTGVETTAWLMETAIAYPDTDRTK